MFVRLFVDENLDRMVPISKQPKEKIQAIIESCSRQFPEFQQRARKRIRTYLKSCRRMKKSGMEVMCLLVCLLALYRYLNILVQNSCDFFQFPRNVLFGLTKR